MSLLGRVWTSLSIAACALLAAPGCVNVETARASAEASHVTPIGRGPFRTQLLLTGELQSVRSVQIKSPQTSLFQMRIQFLAEEGSEVAAGDPLLDFDNSSLASQVRDLEIRILDAETQIVSQRNQLASSIKDLEIAIAEREYELGRTRLEAEVTREVLSDKEYSERQLAYQSAQEELAEIRERIELTRERGTSELDVLTIERDELRSDLLLAEQDLERLSIKAPVAGLVVYERRQESTLRYQEGDSCWPGQGILRLPDLSEMQVVFFVNEVDAPRLKESMPISVELDAFPGRRLGGRIELIPSMAVKRDDASKIAVFKVVAALDESWVGEMKPGMSVRGTVTLDERSDVPLIARRAVTFDGESYWYRSADDATPDRIEPLARNETHYVIAEEHYAELTAARGGKG